MKKLVMKFGGAAFATPSQFSLISELIIKRLNEFSQLIVVVSAMGKTTDQLVELAQEIHEDPPQREFDMLISAGERVSMSLLAMALHKKNQPAISFTGSQSGIITSSRHSEARIIDVRPHRLQESLKEGKIVIVAGFQGVSETKEVTTLGRGGSDTTAVALGVALKAEKVEFYKDVEGVYEQDPKKYNLAKRYPYLTYEDALQIVNRGDKILHPRALQLAAKNGLHLHVKSFMPVSHEDTGTMIYNGDKERSNYPVYEEEVAANL